MAEGRRRFLICLGKCDYYGRTGRHRGLKAGLQARLQNGANDFCTSFLVFMHVQFQEIDGSLCNKLVKVSQFINRLLNCFFMKFEITVNGFFFKFS